MSTLDDARMPSLKDKHLALEEEQAKVEAEAGAENLEKVDSIKKQKKLKGKK